MMNPREFVEKLGQDCEPLYQFQENNVKSFFEKNPSREEMIDYFTKRMVNERVNCTEISKRIVSCSLDTSPEDMFLLSKQALDEAKHFSFLKEIVEDLKGSEVDVTEAVKASIKRQQMGSALHPAYLLEKYEASQDPLALAIYQYIGEGMAARNWAMQAQCAPNELIRSRYEEISRDERFHSNIGKRSLEKQVIDIETQMRAMAIAKEVIEVLWNVGCIAQHIPVNAVEELTSE